MAYKVAKALLKTLLWFAVIIIFLSQQKKVLPATLHRGSPLANIPRSGITTMGCSITELTEKGTAPLWRTVVIVNYSDGTTISRLYSLRLDEPGARKKALLDCDMAIEELRRK